MIKYQVGVKSLYGESVLKNFETRELADRFVKNNTVQKNSRFFVRKVK